MTAEEKTAWRKPSAELTEQFRKAVAPLPGAEPRKMFGCPCAFFNGNMFAGLFAEDVFLRLSPEDRASFLALPGAAVFTPMGARPMREYVVVPREMVAAGSAGWAEWLDKALAYAATLPVKEAKARKKK